MHAIIAEYTKAYLFRNSKYFTIIFNSKL